MRERERESREKREARPEPAVARAKDFYALLSHFRVYIVNWLTSNDEGERAEKEGRERGLTGNGPELRPESYLVRSDWLACLDLDLVLGLSESLKCVSAHVRQAANAVGNSRWQKGQIFYYASDLSSCVVNFTVLRCLSCAYLQTNTNICMHPIFLICRRGEEG